MAKQKYCNEEYDSDNFAYQDDYEENIAEHNYDDYDDYDENDGRKKRKKRRNDDIEQEETSDDKEEAFDARAYSNLDLPEGKKSFDPADYDFNQIMEDYNSGDPLRQADAIEQAVYAMDALVKYVINRHYPTYRMKHYEDMLQTGRMAIVQTLGGYTGKCAPSSYFYTTIRHEIQVFIAEDVHRTTRHYAAMANKIRKAEIALAQIDGKEHHDNLTIAVFTGLPLTTVIETRKQTIAADFVELNPNMDAEDNVNDNYSNPATTYWKEERVQAIRSAINRLSKTEANVITLMYGLGDDAPMNPPAIARRLRLKTDQVRKIAQDACRKLGHDMKLQQEVGVYDQLSTERERNAAELPFISVIFGSGANFFDDVSDDDEDIEISNIDSFFKPMQFADNT